MKGGKAY